MIICHCNGVTDRTVRNAILHGADDPRGVSQACGAGGNCGACLEAVEDLLDRYAVPVLLKSAS